MTITSQSPHNLFTTTKCVSPTDCTYPQYTVSTVRLHQHSLVHGSHHRTIAPCVPLIAKNSTRLQHHSHHTPPITTTTPVPFYTPTLHQHMQSTQCIQSRCSHPVCSGSPSAPTSRVCLEYFMTALATEMALLTRVKQPTEPTACVTLQESHPQTRARGKEQEVSLAL